MNSQIKSKIQAAMQLAMKQQAKERLGVIRMMLAAIKQQEVDTRTELSDGNIIEILTKMVKSCNHAIEQFKAANRVDLIAKDQLEIEVISEFLPAQLSEIQIKAAIDQALLTTKATSIKDMAKVMQYLRTDLVGKADLAMVGKLVKDHLMQNQA